MQVIAPPLRIEARHGGQLLRFILNKPKANIVSLDMIAALRRSIALLPSSTPVKLITLEGAGNHFSFGASVDEHLPGKIAVVLGELHGLVRDLVNLPAWTVAVVRGRCLGGGFELALACDAIVASDDAVLGLPEIGLGVFPPAGTALLPARIGAANALNSLMTGEVFPASWWKSTGLVQAVVPPDRLDGEIDDWFTRYCANRSAAAIRLAARAARWPIRQAIDSALPDLERVYLNDVMGTHDAVEGITAFVERRAPVWRNA